MNLGKRSGTPSFQLITALLVLLLLFPAVQNIIHPHHHDAHHYHGNEIQINGHEAHCTLCSFDFYYYILNNATVQKISGISHPVLIATDMPDILSVYTGYSFLLRGPPLFS